MPDVATLAARTGIHWGGHSYECAENCGAWQDMERTLLALRSAGFAFVNNSEYWRQVYGG
jgi:hypothetical protein